MPLDADNIVDRRRLRRKLTFWRVLAFLAVILAVVITAAVVSDPRRGLTGSRGEIARLSIRGLIRGDTERVEAIERLGRSSVKAVVVHVDSPGGTTAGSEQLHDALRRLGSTQAHGCGSRWSGSIRRLHRRNIRRSHCRPGHFAGRIGRRAVPVSELYRPFEVDRRQSRGNQIVAAEGRSQRFRAHQPGSARRYRGDRDGFPTGLVSLPPGAGAAPSRW